MDTGGLVLQHQGISRKKCLVGTHAFPAIQGLILKVPWRLIILLKKTEQCLQLCMNDNISNLKYFDFVLWCLILLHFFNYASTFLFMAPVVDGDPKRLAKYFRATSPSYHRVYSVSCNELWPVQTMIHEHWPLVISWLVPNVSGGLWWYTSGEAPLNITGRNFQQLLAQLKSTYRWVIARKT